MNERRMASRAPRIKWFAIDAIGAVYTKLGNWRAVADALGELSPAGWQLVTQGKRVLSRDAENALRRYLRMPPRRCTRIDRMRTEDLRWYVENRREVI